MPIDKVPVVHKFGIISHSQRVSLEQRLEQKATVGNVPNTYARTKRLLSEVSDDFVAKFNDSNYDDQQTLLPTASKMLMRAKFMAGATSEGERINSIHLQNLEKICRVCGNRLKKYKDRFETSYNCKDHVVFLAETYNLSIEKDDQTIHPSKFCRECFRSYRIHTREVGFLEKHTDTCSTCRDQIADVTKEIASRRIDNFSKRFELNEVRKDDFYCPICSELLDKPVETIFTHNACGACLTQALAVNSSCP
ncbi:predicted protein, partial [Nematostella vectensis]